jgi:hypothetical protein
MAEQQGAAEKKPEISWAECAKCGGQRRCWVHGYFREAYSNEDYSWRHDWRIMQCCGCEYTFIQTIYSNDWDTTRDRDGDEVPVRSVKYWPALAKRKRPGWIGEFGLEVPDAAKLDDALLEMYGALENDLPILAAIGIRTSFDVASELLGVEPTKTFQQKLTELVEKHHIGNSERSRLEILVNAGNASAHRGWKPSVQNLNIMVDILEHFIHDAFVAPHRKKELDEKVEKMKVGVPAKKPKEASSEQTT